jgi:hypothetical protein
VEAVGHVFGQGGTDRATDLAELDGTNHSIM